MTQFSKNIQVPLNIEYRGILDTHTLFFTEVQPLVTKDRYGSPHVLDTYRWFAPAKDIVF